MTSTAARRRPLAASVAVLAAALSWMVTVPTAGTPAGASPLTAVVDPALHAVQGTVKVIVQGTSSVESAVRRMGGTVTHDLPLIGGFSATVPARDVQRIAHVPGARAITLDRSTHVQGVTLGENPRGSTNNIPNVYRKVTHADQLANVGARGQGVTVALIDTGVTAMPDVANGLQTVSVDPLGQVTTPCVNFTDEPTCDDSYGHGTFMAGLIIGDGTSSNGQYTGMAPRAKVISLKIAGADGSSDVSTIIAALQWVVLNKTTYNIRAINLSLGTDSTQSYHVDPLDFAVEQAWQSGLVVDVAASNRGPAAATISDPANDPFVITVGAVDDKGTSTLNDDVLPNFSGRGPTATDGLAKPDIAAPGAHLVSLAAPGATITTQFPSTMPAPYRRGSGTSMANAVVTGLVADLISAQPTATPNRIKYELTSTARHTSASSDPLAIGAGEVDGWGALNAGIGVANVGVQPGLGTGSLEASRGTVGVVLDNGTNTVLDANAGDVTSLASGGPDGTSWWGTSWWGTSWWGGVTSGTSWWSVPSGTSWWESSPAGTSWWGTSWWEDSPYGTSWWGTSWWGASMSGVNSSTEDYGTSWWGGAWYGAWDQ
jgi:serine protease AprX